MNPLDPITRLVFRSRNGSQHTGVRRSIPFLATRICLSLATVMLLIFSSLEDFAVVGRGPLVALLFVALARALLIARRLDTWLASALVIACLTALVFLSELSRVELVPVMTIAGAAAAAVVVALIFAEAEAFAQAFPGSPALRIVLDPRSLARVGARLLPMVLAIALLLPEMAQVGRQWFPQLEARLAAGSESSRSAGIGNTGFSPSMEPGTVARLEPDPTPILVLKRMKNKESEETIPSANDWFAGSGTTAGVLYLRSYSLSEGFGFKWSMDRRDYVVRDAAKEAPDPDEGNSIMARALLLRTEESFLFHPYGTYIMTAGRRLQPTVPPGEESALVPPAEDNDRRGDEAAPTPQGGAMLLNRPGKGWSSEQIVYSLGRFEPRETREHLQHGSAQIPYPLHPAARSTAAIKLFQSLTGRDVSSAPLEAREALALVRHLFESSGFSYTLEPETVTTPDPLLALSSFVRFTRQGYCEHFATAAASLLQIAGIPTRLVAGLMGRDNGIDDTVIFSRADAHAWLEYLDPRLGQWIAVDPTSWVTSVADLPRQTSASRGLANLSAAWRTELDSVLLLAALSARDVLEAVLKGTRWQDNRMLIELATSSVTLKLALVGALLALVTLTGMALRRLTPTSRQVPGLSRTGTPGLRRLLLRLGIGSGRDHDHTNWDPVARDELVHEICLSIAKQTGVARAETESLREYLARLVEAGKARAEATEELAAHLDRELYGSRSHDAASHRSGGRARRRAIDKRIQRALQPEPVQDSGANP